MTIRGVIRGARHTTKRKSIRGVREICAHHESSTPGLDSWCAPLKGRTHHESNPCRRAWAEVGKNNPPRMTGNEPRQMATHVRHRNDHVGARRVVRDESDVQPTPRPSPAVAQRGASAKSADGAPSRMVPPPAKKNGDRVGRSQALRFSFRL